MKTIAIKEISGVLERIGALNRLAVDAPGATGTLAQHTGNRHHQRPEDTGGAPGRAEPVPGAITGLPTGFRDLDRATTGLHRGELVVVGARPSMGKTTFATHLVEDGGGACEWRTQDVGGARVPEVVVLKGRSAAAAPGRGRVLRSAPVCRSSCSARRRPPSTSS